MKSFFTVLLILGTATVSFAAPNTQNVVLTDAKSKALAKNYVQKSACVRVYEFRTRRTGTSTRAEGVAHAITLRSKTNPEQYYRIFSDRRGNMGYGLLEVGAFSLPQCADFEEL